MMNDKQIPELDQSWSSAEKMLDWHFRKRRFLLIFFALILPTLIGGALYVYSHKGPEKNAESNMVVSNVPGSGIETAVKINHASSLKENAHHELSVNSSLIKPSQSEFFANNNKPALFITGDKKNQHSKNTNPARESEKTITDELVKTNTMNTFSKTANSDYDFREREFLLFADIKNESAFATSRKDHELTSVYPPSNNKKLHSIIGWEAGVYAGLMYVHKSISHAPDLDNYYQHRKSEEETVIYPTTGVSVSAAYKSFIFSFGAEYSVYGEKTNYYPYSNQQTVTNNSLWQTYLSSYIDTDTAYVMGNQLFLNTVLQRQDSSYITHSDTVNEYKYDKDIAARNGYNRFYYFEIPVELTYYVTKGRLGFGFSGGISPAWLIEERGNYIRSDGNGLDSFGEIKYFRKFMMNARVSADIYYRISSRVKLQLRPQLRSNLSSVFNSDFPVRQKYYSGGVLFGVSYFLN
jgi:hypothetical protein